MIICDTCVHKGQCSYYNAAIDTSCPRYRAKCKCCSNMTTVPKVVVTKVREGKKLVEKEQTIQAFKCIKFNIETTPDCYCFWSEDIYKRDGR